MFFFTSINGDYTSNLILKNTLWGMRAKCCWEPTVGPTGSENNLVRIAQAVRCWTGTQVYMRVCASCFSRVQLCATVWTVACQAPLCMGFSRHEYWPPPGDLPYPWIKFVSLRSPALAGGIFTTSATWESYILDCKSSVRPRKSLLPFFFFWQASLAFCLPSARLQTQWLEMDQQMEKEKKGWTEGNWKYFLLRGSRRKRRAKNSGCGLKAIEFWGKWDASTPPWRCEESKAAWPFWRVGSKCVLGGSKNGSTCSLGGRSWEERTITGK